jgi:hypothetical protein
LVLRVSQFTFHITQKKKKKKTDIGIIEDRPKDVKEEDEADDHVDFGPPWNN